MDFFFFLSLITLHSIFVTYHSSLKISHYSTLSVFDTITQLIITQNFQLFVDLILVTWYSFYLFLSSTQYPNSPNPVKKKKKKKKYLNEEDQDQDASSVHWKSTKTKPVAIRYINSNSNIFLCLLFFSCLFMFDFFFFLIGLGFLDKGVFGARWWGMWMMIDWWSEMVFYFKGNGGD